MLHKVQPAILRWPHAGRFLTQAGPVFYSPQVVTLKILGAPLLFLRKMEKLLIALSRGSL